MQRPGLPIPRQWQQLRAPTAWPGRAAQPQRAAEHRRRRSPPALGRSSSHLLANVGEPAQDLLVGQAVQRARQARHAGGEGEVRVGQRGPHLRFQFKGVQGGGASEDRALRLARGARSERGPAAQAHGPKPTQPARPSARSRAPGGWRAPTRCLPRGRRGWSGRGASSPGSPHPCSLQQHGWKAGHGRECVRSAAAGRAPRRRRAEALPATKACGAAQQVQQAQRSAPIWCARLAAQSSSGCASISSPPL